MATPSSILAWEIPWTEEPGELKSVGSQEWDSTVTKPPAKQQKFVLTVLKGKVWKSWSQHGCENIDTHSHAACEPESPIPDCIVCSSHCPALLGATGQPHYAR